MEVDQGGDNTNAAFGVGTSLHTKPETRKRKLVLEPPTPAPSSTWQDLHAAQDRLLAKLDRAQADGHFALLPLLQAEYAMLQEWEHLQRTLDDRRQ